MTENLIEDLPLAFLSIHGHDYDWGKDVVKAKSRHCIKKRISTINIGYGTMRESSSGEDLVMIHLKQLWYTEKYRLCWSLNYLSYKYRHTQTHFSSSWRKNVYAAEFARKELSGQFQHKLLKHSIPHNSHSPKRLLFDTTIIT